MLINKAILTCKRCRKNIGYIVTNFSQEMNNIPKINKVVHHNDMFEIYCEECMKKK